MRGRHRWYQRTIRKLFLLGRFGKTESLFVSAMLFAALVAATGASQSHTGATKYATITNVQAREMLDKIQGDIKEYYYDPTMHGVDLDKKFDEARQKIAAAKSQDEALLSIAGAVAALKDSHTTFRPPARPYGVDYGWIMQAIGDSDCYVTAVRPESDAAAKGLKPGDRMLSINGVPLVRANINAIEYGYRVFPQSGFHLAVRSADGAERTLVTMAKVIPGQIV